METTDQRNEDSDTMRREVEVAEAATLPLPEARYIGVVLDGRYLIESKLGAGGFGAVYLAADQKMVSRKVVAKILHDETAKNAWVVSKFKQEIEALTRINHPGVVGVFDTGQTAEGHPFIIMQYVEGVTLRSLMTSEGMPFWRVAKIISEMGRALAAAHQAGVLHRDLKPENIMLEPLADDEEHVKIIDFGVAKIKNSMVSHSTIEAQTVGTLYYMSPEQLTARPLTTATDVYSMGVIAYEMLTGKRPINPESVFQLLEMQRLGVRVKPSDLRPALPQEAEPVLLKALAFEPQDRYQRARDFADALASALLADDDLTTRPSLGRETNAPGLDGVEQSVRRQDRRGGSTNSKTPLRVGILSLIILLAAAGVWYALRPKDTKATVEKVVPATLVGPEQSLTYWLTVQKMLNHQPLGSPIDSAGDISFGNGWKFHFNVRPLQSGSLYLLNAGPGEKGGEEYNVLFPLPEGDHMDSRIAANETKRTGPYDFVDQTGVEKLWIIWSSQPVAELDSIFLAAVRDKKAPGVISDLNQISRLQEYLKKYDSERPQVIPDKTKKLTFIKGRGEIIVDRVELAHEAY